ncbi:hypothetical protein GC163_16805 [bacterium]|nr:hypothetical protein [bacterium]
MFSPEVFFPVIARVAELLRQLGIRFHLTGGLVSVYYAEPRLTQDADLVVDPQQLQGCLEEFLSAVQSGDWLVDDAVIRDAVSRGRMFQMIDVRECVKLDIYPRELIPGELKRSLSVNLTPTLQIPIASRGDLVLSKLIWISKGSHKSRRDVRQLMQLVNPAENDAIREFAAERQLTDLLNEVLGEPDEIDA